MSPERTTGDAGAQARKPEPSERPAGARRRWMLAAGAVLALGLAGSVVGALLWRSSVRARERETFQTAATNVSGRLEMQLRRDTDFVRSIRAVMTLQPDLTASGFRQWFAQLEDREGQTTGFGALVVKSVPAAQLARFQAQRDADPAFRAFVGGQVQPVAQTGRASYCLLAAGSADISFSPELTAALQGDWCDPTSLIGGYAQGGTTRAKFTQEITDSGQFAAYTTNVSGVSSLILEASAYRRGAPLTDAPQRSAAVLGWVLGSFDLSELRKSVLGDDRGLAVTLDHENPGLHLEHIGRIGSTAGSHLFTRTAKLSVDGTWIIDVSGAGLLSGPSAGIQGLVVFLGGILATLLLLAVVVVLARSREHALAMVREKTTQLRHQALHDPLTGLPNRVLALDRGEQMLSRARRANLSVAALYVDLDGFKQVNDTFGHATGDELLRAVALRLASVVREGDTAARLGGDEFIVLVEGSTLDAGPELVAERLLEVLDEPYDLGGAGRSQLTVTASIGIAFGPREDADELLRDADTALYEAKATGRNRYVSFQSAMQSHVHDRITIQMELAEALERSQLFLQYLPVFDLQSEGVIGVEALIRWHHPSRGVVPASEFVPVAEETGLIVPIGRWVLEQACQQAARWHQQGLRLAVSVNVSARQLDGDRLIDDVEEALRSSGLDPATLTLEVAETTLMRDPQDIARRLNLLKDLGVRIAIDDVATGYSALSQLRRFPVDALKFDRSFMRGIAAAKHPTSLMHELVRLGRTLKIETLAEGIEDHTYMQAVQDEHFDHGQGFLLAHSLDVDEVEAFVQASEDRSRAEPAR
jgi:diguanylate cyclase (GGDEF)-like protein